MMNEIFDEGITHSEDVRLFGEYRNISYRRCKFERGVVFEDVDISENVEFINCDFSKGATLKFISGKYLGDVRIGINGGRIHIRGGEYSKIKIGYWGPGNDFGELQIAPMSSLKGSIDVYDCDINNILISGRIDEYDLKLSNIKSNKITLNYIRCSNDIMLNDVESLKSDKHTEFNIMSSELGESSFVNVDFDSFSKFNIRKSFINKCHFMFCKMDKKIYASYGTEDYNDPIVRISSNIEVLKDHINASIDKVDINLMKESLTKNNKTLADAKKREKEIYSKLAKENYKQLKMSFQKVNDRIEEQRFHALEMREYSNMNISLQDKIIIVLSYLTSNFGHSLWRPFIFNITRCAVKKLVRTLSGSMVYY